jgi:hypothetical protein
MERKYCKSKIFTTKNKFIEDNIKFVKDHKIRESIIENLKFIEKEIERLNKTNKMLENRLPANELTRSKLSVIKLTEWLRDYNNKTE